VAEKPMAVVLGARVIEVVRSLAMEGIPVGAVTPTGDPARWSRYARNVMTWDWMLPAERHDDALADRLVRFARRQACPPVLLYCSDQSMVFVSQHRTRLAEGFRFAVPDAALVESMEDKARFAALATTRALPVPPTVVLDGRLPEPPDELLDLGMPMIVKPTARDRTWVAAAGSSAKAVRIDTKEQLLELWPRLSGLSKPAIAQENIPGPETAGWRRSISSTAPTGGCTFSRSTRGSPCGLIRARGRASTSRRSCTPTSRAGPARPAARSPAWTGYIPRTRSPPAPTGSR